MSGMKTLPTGDYFLKNTSFLQFDCLNPHSSFSIFYNSQLSPGSTIQINQSETLQAINSIEINDLTVDGNGNSGGSVEIMARNSVTLKDGFWAKSGSSVFVHAGPFFVPCETWPDVLFESKNRPQTNTGDQATEIEVHFDLETEIVDVRIFPNPSEGTCQIEIIGSAPERIHVSVFDCLGQLMQAFHHSGVNTFIINLKDYPAGAYYTIIKADGWCVSKRMIKY